MKKTLVLGLLLLIPNTTSAETLKLKSGKIVEGDIIEKTEEYTKINFQGIELTYYRDEMEDDDKASTRYAAPMPADSLPSHQKQKVFDKLDLKTLNLQNTEIPTAGILKIIKEKIKPNENITFEYNYESFSGDGRHDLEQGKAYVKSPDIWREETQSNYGGKRIEIKNVNELWRIETVKFVHKTNKPSAFDKAPFIYPEFSSWNNRETIGFNVFHINPVRIESLQYRGEEPLDGVPCYVLAEEEDYRQKIFWIAKDSGVLRKYLIVENSFNDPKYAISQTSTSWTVNVKKTGQVSNIKFNENLSDSLFQYALKEGDQVEEENEVNGETVKKNWVVPYQKAALTGDEALQKRAKLNEVLTKYEQVKEFACSYKYHEKDEKGAKLGPPIKPGEEFDPMKMADNLITPEKTQSGILKFKKPTKLSYVYDVTSNLDYENTKGSFVLTDGVDFWDYSMPPRTFGNTQSLKMVTKQKVKDIQSLFSDMMLSAENYKERAKRFQDPNNPALIDPPVMKPHELVSGSHFVRLPASVLEPFKNLDTELIEFQGEEEIRGEKTYRFKIKESPDNRKSVHWIGVNDGIPRQIHEYDWVGDLVAMQMELTDVKVNPNLADADFVFKNDGTFQVQDMSQTMPDTAKMLKQAFDTPPEDTFTRNFDTPLNKVENLKGSGMFFRGGEAFIRFNCFEDVSLKNSKDYVDSTDEIAEIADYFKKSFPEDAKILKDPADLTLKKYLVKSVPGKQSEEGKILLENKKQHTYFFKMWVWMD